jgi:hypothetical protein
MAIDGRALIKEHWSNILKVLMALVLHFCSDTD